MVLRPVWAAEGEDRWVEREREGGEKNPFYFFLFFKSISKRISKLV
jgi:hypothetical protein